LFVLLRSEKWKQCSVEEKLENKLEIHFWTHKTHLSSKETKFWKEAIRVLCPEILLFKQSDYQEVKEIVDHYKTRPSKTKMGKKIANAAAKPSSKT
jgi:hypothetical protein